MGEAEFRCLMEFPQYEINREGVVRRVSGRLITVQEKKRSGVKWVGLTCGYKSFGRTVSVLLEETFGPGAAKAAGLKEPDMRRVKMSRARTGTGRAKGGRTCTTCGKPTANYRCEGCWREVRGFGFGTSNEHANPFEF